MVKRILLVAAVVGVIICGSPVKTEAADLEGYSQSAANDYKNMKNSLGIDGYEARIEKAKKQDDEYDEQHQYKTNSIKYEMDAYAGVVSDGYGKLFSALGSSDFDKARILAMDWVIDKGVWQWYRYNGPEYDYIDVAAIGQTVGRYVPGAKDSNDHSAKLNEKIAEFVASFTEENDKKMKDFFKKVFKNPWPYYDDRNKKESQATFIYPKCAKRTLYYPEAYRNYTSNLSAMEVILNYEFWAEEGLGVYVHSNIWMGSEDESAISGMLQNYEIIDQGGDMLILENPKYKEYVLIHNFKGRKSLAMIYFIDGTGELAKQMTFYLKDYLSSGSVNIEDKPDEESDLGKFDIEALDKTTLAASPGEPNICRLKVSVIRSTKDENGKIVIKPAKGARVSFEKPRWGKLSAEQVVTDASGEAIVTYEAPTEKELADKNQVSVDITVRGENPGEYDYVPITVENTSGEITAEVDHEILPSVSKYYSRITFKFRGPDKEYKAIVSVKQKDGALVEKLDDKGGTNRLEMEVRPGSTNEVFYHWVGNQEMTSAQAEIITIEIPDLKLEEELKISVGIDLQPLRVENSWTGSALPGVYHPFKVYVNDGFHPKADVGELFKKFPMRLDLKVNQEYYAPVTIYDPDKEGWLSRLVSHIEGAVIPHGALTNNLIKAKLEKSKQGDYFLIAEDWKEEKNAEAALPGAIPYDRGNYQFGFGLSYEYDANKNNNQILSPMIDVEEYSTHGEMLNGFLVPTMKSYVSMIPGAGLVLYSIDTGVNLKQGNYKEAIVDTALQIGSDVAGDWVNAKRKELLEGHFKNIIAKAKYKTVSQLSKKEVDYCLRRAKEQYVGNLGNAIASWTMEKVKDELMTKKALRKSPTQNIQSTGWEFLQLFLKGYGDYGLVVLTKDGLNDYKVYDQKGNELKDAPVQMFSGPEKNQRIFDGKEVIVVPFMLGEEIEVQAEGAGGSGNIITITPDGVSTQEYPKEKWQSKIQISSNSITNEGGGGLDVSGKWKTGFGTLILSQSASKVTGNYTSDDGKIEGAMEGNILKGTWSESPSYKPPKDAGDFEFVFSEDGKSFKGKWRYGHGGSGWKGNWSGTRI